MGGSPRTRFSGSLMLTVWSWEADKELLMDRSAGDERRGHCGKGLLGPNLLSGEALPLQVCRARPRRLLEPESQRVPSAEIPVRR